MHLGNGEQSIRAEFPAHDGEDLLRFDLAGLHHALDARNEVREGLPLLLGHGSDTAENILVNGLPRSLLKPATEALGVRSLEGFGDIGQLLQVFESLERQREALLVNLLLPLGLFGALLQAL